MAIALNFKNHAVIDSLLLFLVIDSSKVATAFMLWQLVDGEIFVVNMDSRIFSEEEMNMPSIVRESLGIVYSLRKNKPVVRSHTLTFVLLSFCRGPQVLTTDISR